MGLLGSRLDCDSIEIKFDQVVECLADYIVMSAGVPAAGNLQPQAAAAIGEICKVMELRGNVLFIQRRVKKFGGGYHLSMRS